MSVNNMVKSSHFWRVWLPPHLFAAIGLWFYASWQVLIVALVCYTLISGLGVAVGFHRYFSHKAFRASPFWQQQMLFWGSLACHGNPLFWVALHRGLHHRYSDTEKDPHSPVAHSLWHSYQGYAFDPKLVDQVPVRAGADFLRHPEWMWTVNRYHTILWLVWVLVFLCSVAFKAPWLLIGLACAQVWAIHQEALVNVLGHKPWFGAYRNFETNDQSVNRNWLGLITWGQSLHNNHHGDAGNPSFAQSDKFHQHFEFDPSMLWVWLIEATTAKPAEA